MAQPPLFYDFIVRNQPVIDNFLEVLEKAPNEIDVFRQILDEEMGNPDELDDILHKLNLVGMCSA